MRNDLLTSQTLADYAMAPPSAEEKKTLPHLWRQGCFLPQEAFAELENKTSETNFAILITHDCDCVSEISSEPFLELMLGRYLDGEPAGNFTRGKSTRILHLPISSVGKNIELNAAISKRSIRKDWLLKFSPDANITLTDAEKRTLSHWLALRYERPAFPDELVRRLQQGNASDIFATACKKTGEEIQGVYITYDPRGELTDKELYCLSVRVVWNSEIDGAEGVAKSIADKIKKKFEKVFNYANGPTQEWLGIELDICEAVEDLDFTLRDVRTHEAWKNDEISLADDSGLPIRG